MRLALVAGLVGLLACSPTAAPSISISESPAPVSATRVVVASAVSRVQVGSPSPVATRGPLVSPAVLTDVDNGAVVQLHVGERVELRLDAALTWTVTFEDPSVARQSGAGFIEAIALGKTTLSADGEPACRRVTPPCGLPNRLFQVQVDVLP